MILIILLLLLVLIYQKFYMKFLEMPMVRLFSRQFLPAKNFVVNVDTLFGGKMVRVISDVIFIEKHVMILFDHEHSISEVKFNFPPKILTDLFIDLLYIIAIL